MAGSGLALSCLPFPNPFHLMWGSQSKVTIYSEERLNLVHTVFPNTLSWLSFILVLEEIKDELFLRDLIISVSAEMSP